MRIRRALVAGLLGALTVLGLGTVPAHAAPVPAAATCAGVWVVVDYGSLGGTSTSCATSFSTGTAALRGAGFSPTLDNGMITKINGVPATVNMQDHYWSYWHASLQADGSYSGWTYSSLGANAYHPTAGSADGWRYQALADGYVSPGVAPPKKMATTAPATTAPAPAQPTTKAATRAATSGAVATTGAPATSAATVTTSDATTDGPSTTPSASVSASSDDTPAAVSPPSQENPGPRLNSMIGAVGAIIAIAVATVALAVWRKRKMGKG